LKDKEIIMFKVRIKIIIFSIISIIVIPTLSMVRRHSPKESAQSLPINIPSRRAESEDETYFKSIIGRPRAHYSMKSIEELMQSRKKVEVENQNPLKNRNKTPKSEIKTWVKSILHNLIEKDEDFFGASLGQLLAQAEEEKEKRTKNNIIVKKNIYGAPCIFRPTKRKSNNPNKYIPNKRFENNYHVNTTYTSRPKNLIKECQVTNEEMVFILNNKRMLTYYMSKEGLSNPASLIFRLNESEDINKLEKSQLATILDCVRNIKEAGKCIERYPKTLLNKNKNFYKFLEKKTGSSGIAILTTLTTLAKIRTKNKIDTLGHIKSIFNINKQNSSRHLINLLFHINEIEKKGKRWLAFINTGEYKKRTKKQTNNKAPLKHLVFGKKKRNSKSHML